jgi:hypothetical protein
MCKIWSENLNPTDHLENLGIDQKIIFKFLKETDGNSVVNSGCNDQGYNT